ncbi:MAG: PAS domain-containing protein, partial [Armatimonadetes bacterium]|nr:PAS domain-containing protein [Armatimonadota bacterium]
MNTAQRPVNQSLCESIVAHMPARILVVDQDMTIRYANPTYCKMRGVSLDEIMGTSLEDLFPAALLSEAGLAEAISNTITHQHGTHWSGYRQPTPDHGERVIDIRLDPCLYEGEELVLLTIQDVSERHRQLYERDIIQQISRVMLSIVNLPRLL